MHWQLPVAHHALRRDLQHLGGLFNAQSAEETQSNKNQSAGVPGLRGSKMLLGQNEDATLERRTLEGLGTERPAIPKLADANDAPRNPGSQQARADRPNSSILLFRGDQRGSGGVSLEIQDGQDIIV